MRSLLFLGLLVGTVAAQQDSNSSTPAGSPASDSSSSQSIPKSNPKLAPPRSDRVDAASLGDAAGESSSRDTQIDLSPPPNDAKEHPQSSDILKDEGYDAGGEERLHR